MVELNTTIENITATADAISTIQEGHSLRISSIEERLASLEMRLSNAKAWFKYRGKPSQIDGNRTASYGFTMKSSAILQVSKAERCYNFTGMGF